MTYCCWHCVVLVGPDAAVVVGIPARQGGGNTQAGGMESEGFRMAGHLQLQNVWWKTESIYETFARWWVN